MIDAPYNSNKQYDEYLESAIKTVKQHISEKDDDFLLMLVGETGTGKSTIALHLLDSYMGERASVDQVAMSKEELANSMKIVAASPKPRALIYDEANVNKRASMTGWNRDLLDLYYSNRGLNILHLWCNPSLHMIDQAFLEDRIKGVLLVVGKKNKVFRYYYYFRAKALDEILSKYGRLTIKILKKTRKKYSWYKGWFKDYQGILKQPYLDKKKNRMHVKVEQFFEKYGEDDTMKRSDVAKHLRITNQTIWLHTKDLKEGEDYTVTTSNRYKYSRAGIEKLKNIIKKARKGVENNEQND